MSEADFIRQLAHDHQRLMAQAGLEALDLPQLATTTLGRTGVSIEAADDAEKVIANAADAPGWLRRESWAGLLTDDPGRAQGVVLEGEWAVSEQSSCSLFYDGRRWRLVTLTEGTRDGKCRDEIRDVLREEITLLWKDSRRLRYAVYWGAPTSDVAAMTRLASRLLGIEVGR